MVPCIYIVATAAVMGQPQAEPASFPALVDSQLVECQALLPSWEMPHLKAVVDLRIEMAQDEAGSSFSPEYAIWVHSRRTADLALDLELIQYRVPPTLPDWMEAKAQTAQLIEGLDSLLSSVDLSPRISWVVVEQLVPRYEAAISARAYDPFTPGFGRALPDDAVEELYVNFGSLLALAEAGVDDDGALALGLVSDLSLVTQMGLTALAEHGAALEPDIEALFAREHAWRTEHASALDCLSEQGEVATQQELAAFAAYEAAKAAEIEQ